MHDICNVYIIFNISISDLTSQDRCMSRGNMKSFTQVYNNINFNTRHYITTALYDRTVPGIYLQYGMTTSRDGRLNNRCHNTKCRPLPQNSSANRALSTKTLFVLVVVVVVVLLLLLLVVVVVVVVVEEECSCRSRQ